MTEEKQIKIKVKEDDLKGQYSNLMRIFHTKDEFIMDFFLISPPQGVLSSRIIMSPGHLKRMTKVLQDNISRHEKKFGKIEIPKNPAPEEDLGFKVNNK